MKKPLLAAITALFLSVFSAQAVFAATDSSKEDDPFHNHATVYINGEKQNLWAVIPPSGSTVVPFRTFFSILKIDAQFDNTTKTVTATNNDTTITLTAGKLVATLNGKEVKLLQGPSIDDDNMMYVNLRFIVESFGATVAFDKSTLSIYIQFPDLKTALAPETEDSN